jgi:hypothetical protein
MLCATSSDDPAATAKALMADWQLANCGLFLNLRVSTIDKAYCEAVKRWGVPLHQRSEVLARIVGCDLLAALAQGLAKQGVAGMGVKPGEAVIDKMPLIHS